MMLDTDMIEGKNGTGGEEKGAQRYDGSHRAVAAAQQRDAGSDDGGIIGPALIEAELAGLETADILEEQRAADNGGARDEEKADDGALRGGGDHPLEIAQDEEPANQHGGECRSDEHQPPFDEVANLVAECPEQRRQKIKAQRARDQRGDSERREGEMGDAAHD